MLVPSWLLENPFRVLRLSASATLADAHEAASAMSQMVELNTLAPAESDIPSLGPLTRTEASIQAALERIETPSQRLFDRFFWFHQATLEEITPAGVKPANKVPGLSAQRTAVRHDDALRAFLHLYESDRVANDLLAWVEAFHAWHAVLTSPEYWELSEALEKAGSFKPRASEEEFEAVWQSAMLRAAEPLLSAVEQALSDDDDDTLKAILRVVDSLTDTGDWVHVVRATILEPLTASVKRACSENLQMFLRKISRNDESVEANIQPCNDLLQHYRQVVQPALARLQRVAPQNNKEEQKALDTVAPCLINVADAFTWADRFVEAEALLDDAHSLTGEKTIARMRIRLLTDKINARVNVKVRASQERQLKGLSAEVAATVKRARRDAIHIVETGRASLLREPFQEAQNKPVCDAMLAKFRTELQPMMRAAVAALPPRHSLVLTSELAGDEALCLHKIALDYADWAGEPAVSLELLQKAQVIAVDSYAAATAREGIAKVNEILRQQREFKGLVRLKKPPRLGTIVGGRLYGRFRYDEPTRSFDKLYYLTFCSFRFFRCIDIASYEKTNRTGFLGGCLSARSISCTS